jgi:hypothetical protein
VHQGLVGSDTQPSTKTNKVPCRKANSQLSHSLGKGEVDSSILSGSTSKNSVAQMLYPADRDAILRSRSGELANMQRWDVSIWFMIAAAVFAVLAVLALLLAFGPW